MSEPQAPQPDYQGGEKVAGDKPGASKPSQPVKPAEQRSPADIERPGSGGQVNEAPD